MHNGIVVSKCTNCISFYRLSGINKERGPNNASKREIAILQQINIIDSVFIHVLELKHLFGILSVSLSVAE